MEKWIRLCCIIEKCSPVFDGLVQFFMGRLEGGESHWMEKIFVDEEIAVRFIWFKIKYFLIRKYKLQGVCGKERIWA